jgi:hypothetical protein
MPTFGTQAPKAGMKSFSNFDKVMAVIATLTFVVYLLAMWNIL